MEMQPKPSFRVHRIVLKVQHVGRLKKMKRLQRLQSAKSWLETVEQEPKQLVKAYRKRYGVDWSTAFHELELLGVKIDPVYKEQALGAVQRDREAKRKKKAIRSIGVDPEELGILDEELLELEIPAQPRSRNKKDIPYDELDANMVSLVNALNNYPAVVTIGSCGGHEHPTNLSQWEAGSWYVKFDVMPDRTGWYVLEHLAWAVNEDSRLLGGENVILLPVSAPPYLNTPGQCLHFVIEGHDGADPDELAKFLNEVRSYLTKKR